MGPAENTQVTGRRCSSVTQIFPYASGFLGRLCTDSLALRSRLSFVEDNSVDVWEFDGDEKADGGEVSLLSLLALLVLLERRGQSASDSNPDDWDSSPTASSAKQSRYMSLMCFLCWSIVF